MGKLIRLGATALSMIGILVMILCVQAAILFVRLCIRRKQKKIELNQGNDHSNSVANYLVNVMLEERRADDIRIGHLDGFLFCEQSDCVSAGKKV